MDSRAPLMGSSQTERGQGWQSHIPLVERPLPWVAVLPQYHLSARSISG